MDFSVEDLLVLEYSLNLLANNRVEQFSKTNIYNMSEKDVYNTIRRLNHFISAERIKKDFDKTKKMYRIDT